MVDFIQIVVLVFGLGFLFLAARTSLDVSMGGMFGIRGRPKIQIRSSPYVNGRFILKKHKEHGYTDFKVKIGTFKAIWKMDVPRWAWREVPPEDTEHHEGMYVIEEYKLDKKASEPIYDWFKNLVFYQEQKMSLLTRKINTIVAGIEAENDPNVALTSIRGVLTEIEEIKKTLEGKKAEASPLFIDISKPEEKKIGSPAAPAAQPRP